MRAWIALHNSALATSKSRTDRFLKGQIRLNLKGIFVDFGVNDLRRDSKIKRGTPTNPNFIIIHSTLPSYSCFTKIPTAKEK